MAKASEKSFENPVNREKLMREISRVAYEIYEKRGHKSGNELGDWFEAERLVRKQFELLKK